MKKQLLPICCICIALLLLILAALSCKKKSTGNNTILPGNIEHATAAGNGSTYKVYA